MKKYLLYILLPALALASTTFFSTIPNGMDAPDTDGEETMDDWLFAQKAFPYGKPDIQAQKSAVHSMLQLQNKKRLLKTEEDADWEFVGPISIGGRILDIDCPAGNHNTIFVGSASGGVLRSYDGGDHWQNIFDAQPTLSIGDIAIDPVDTNTLYIGTGEPGNGTGSVTYDGYGIYRSTNGGDSWENIGLENGGNTGRIAINPQNTNIIFAAMLGDLFNNNPERGIYRSTDGGTSWEQVLYVNDSTGGIDVAINPINPDIIYAATWERTRRYNSKDYSGPGSRIYRSTDGGDTWNMLTTGLPGGDIAKIAIALAPSDPDVLYASFTGTNERLIDIYKTTNGGDAWTALDCFDEVPTTTQDTWYAGVRVDPNDADIVYWIGFTCARSFNGGDTWSGFATDAHVDCHALYIDPVDPAYKIMGSDGGLFFTQNNFATYTQDQNIPVTQLYSIDVSPQDTAYIIGGAQDNGSFKKDPAGLWSYAYGGDGVSVKWIPDFPDSYFANYQYAGYFGKVNGGYPFFSGLDFGDRFNWRSPLELNPLNASTVYFGGTKMYRSTNYAYSVSTISDDLTNGNQGTGLVFGSIFTIHNAAADTNYIYVGTDDANVWRSKDYGDSWQLVTDGLPYRYCMNFDTDPEDAEKVYVVFSGFRWADDMAHIYVSENAGDSWTPISGDMTDIPVNDIKVIRQGDTTILAVATDVGCFYSMDDGAHWEALGTSMPIVSVYELYYHAATNTLFAGTYGRGVWKIKMEFEPQDPIGINETDLPEISIYPNPVSDVLHGTITHADANMRLQIFDMQGKLVSSTDMQNENTFHIPVRDLAMGKYMLTISIGEKHITKSFVKN